MKERPILFSGPMVRAILNGVKSQTRRAVKPVGNDGGFVLIENAGRLWPYRSDDGESGFHTVKRGGNEYLDETPHECPYGQPGDRLWVRESWSPDPPDVDGWGYTAWAGCREGQITGVPERFRHPRFCNYAADWLHSPIRWTPSIHMPRWASRITLEITGVRVERLQDINEQDALAEGVTCENVIISTYYANGHHEVREDRYFFGGCQDEGFDSAVEAYAALLESINGAGSWAENPWVWVVEFRRLP